VRTRPYTQIYRRVSNPQLTKENRAHRIVVVLTRVDKDLFDCLVLFESFGNYGGFHELRSRPNDGNYSHGFFAAVASAAGALQRALRSGKRYSQLRVALATGIESSDPAGSPAIGKHDTCSTDIRQPLRNTLPLARTGV
jgi:hypothetical protein